LNLGIRIFLLLGSVGVVVTLILIVALILGSPLVI
jgi:hypothetical protein